MEPLNSVASVSAAGDACEIWCGTQSQTMAVAAVAKALGIAPEKVKLNLMLLGGGFGRRGHRDEEFVVDSVLLSREVKRPVKVLWTRDDDVENGRVRPLSVHFLRAGLDGLGRIVAWQHRVACDEITAFQDPLRYKGGGEKDFLAMAGSELRTYDIPNRLSEQLPQETGIRTSSLRGIGFGPNKFATEAFLDEVAAKHGLDPVELRLQLLKNTPRGQAVIRAVVEMSDYRRKRPGRGLGFSFIDYAGTMVAAVAEVSVDKARGKVSVHDFWLALDPGIAVQPDNVVAQTESSIVYGLGLALTERITIKDGAVRQSNILDYGVPRMHDIPELDVKLMSTPNRPTGAGQMATPIVAPAIARSSHHAAKRVPVSVARDARDVAQRHDACGARGVDHLLLGHEERLLGRLHAVFEREILAADVHRRVALDRHRDLRHAEKRCRRLDHRDEAGVAGFETALRLELRNDFVEPPQVRRIVHFRDLDGVHVGADRGLEIARRHRVRSVDAHRHVGSPAPHPGRGPGDELARVVLLVGGDAILQVEQDAVGAAGVRLLHVFLDVHRHVQQRAPHRKSRFHSCSPLGVPPPSHTMPAATSFAYAALSTPISASTARLCSPSFGAGARIAPGVRERRGVTWCMGKAPMSGSG